MPEIHQEKKHQFLRDIWGYHHFRPQQEAIIDCILQGRDALVIMPTGGGKSLCYQLPALIKPGIAVVISPLIALMNDQVQALIQSGVKVAAIHSNMTRSEIEHTERLLLSGEVKLLYVSPERANTVNFLTSLGKLNVSLFAIDEAHCVSIWGNDFRPDYVELHKLRDSFSSVPFVALTATADAATQEDIISQLHLKNPEKFISSFERKNIITESRPAQNRYRQILDFLRQVSGQSGIIYCLSRRETEVLSQKLKGAGYDCAFYHAGMNPSERNEIQKAFQDDKLQFICATIAFGMGIDKSNIRWIIHYSMPKNLEGYYQEIGRSGRDGQIARALLFYTWGDYQTLKSFIDSSDAPEEFRTVQYAKLQRMWEFANATDCRTNMVLNYFGEYRDSPCGHCDNCLKPPVSFDATIPAQKALSAIIRVNEEVGMNMLIDILRGSRRAEVIQSGYDHIKTFGTGTEFSFVDWKIYITQMINQGLIRIDYTDHFKLKSTPLSRAVLKGEKTVRLVNLSQIENVVEEPRTRTMVVSFESELTQLLRTWRNDMAKALNVPAYIIFNDETMAQIVQKVPLTREDLREVEGIGKQKLEQFGKDILNIIRQFVVAQPFKKNVKGMTQWITQSMAEHALPPDEIAAKRAFSMGTVYSHLAYLVGKGESFDLAPYITDTELQKVEQAWIRSGKKMELATIADHLTEPIDFNKMRLALAVSLRKEMK